MKRLINTLKKAALMLSARYLGGYIVYAPEYNGMHFTMSLVEANEWQAMYPQGVAWVVCKGVAWNHHTVNYYGV